MKPWLKWTLGLIIVGGYVACSPKEFSTDCPSGCTNGGTARIFNYVETVDFGKVDVLIVNDNSASMSFEQNELANRFNGFIQNLENKGVNYRIGVVTTDISSSNNPPRAANGNGALQDGNLIAFSNGNKFLTKADGSISQKDTLFKTIIKRPETLACENFINSQLASCGGSQSCMDTRRADPAYGVGYTAACPSGDERGILAANLVVQNNPDSFLRPEADLAVIVLADEDERSANYRSPVAGSTSARSEKHNYDPSFALAEQDKASAFKALMQSKYPSKKYAVHPIIVRSNDQGCLEQQNAQTLGVVNGSYGKEYEWLNYHCSAADVATYPTKCLAADSGSHITGVVGSVCASDYSAILQNIFNNVTVNAVSKITLHCANPDGLTLSPPPPGGWTLVGNEVRFATNLAPGTAVNVSYTCPAVN